MAALSLLTFGFLLASPAHAAHWAVTSYTCSGTDNGFNYYNGQPVSQTWKTSQTPDGTGAGGGSSFSYWRSGTSAGSITPVLTWTPDYPGDPAPVPATVSALVTVHVLATAYGTTNAPTASDNQGDTFTASPPSGGNISLIANPVHLLQKDNPSLATVVSLPAVILSVTASTVAGQYVHVEDSLITQISTGSLQAHSTLDASTSSTPWDPTHPLFFSGTNCMATAVCPSISGSVKQVQLSVNGILAKEYDDTASLPTTKNPNVIYTSGTSQPSVTLPITFDSTYFLYANLVPVLVSVTDTSGKTYTASVSARTANDLLAEGNQTSSANDPVTGQNVAENAVSGAAQGQKGQANFQPYPGVATQTNSTHFPATPMFLDHKSDLETRLGLSGWTSFFMATHSNQGYLGDCYSTPTSDSTTYLNDVDIQSAVSTRTATLSSPYLFVFVHGCDGGGSTTLANDFGIPSISTDDRAFAGFPATIAVNQRNTNFSVYLWHLLLSGETLTDATYDAHQLYPVQLYIDKNTPPNDNHTTAPILYGDDHMTLYGKVYNWTSGSLWYR